MMLEKDRVELANSVASKVIARGSYKVDSMDSAVALTSVGNAFLTRSPLAIMTAMGNVANLVKRAIW